MLAFRRRCAQTARISLHSSNFQRAKTQNNRTANSLAHPATLHPDILQTSLKPSAALATPSLPSVSPSLPSASFSVFRFGEAVFTETRHQPQEEKSRPSHFFRISLFPHKIWGLDPRQPLEALHSRNIIAAMQRESGGL